MMFRSSTGLIGDGVTLERLINYRVVVSQPNRADGRLPKEGDTIEVGWSREAAVVLPDEGVAGPIGKEEHR